MTAQAQPMPALVDALRLAHFAMMDRLRRAQGDALDALGLGPRECAFKLVCSGPHWRLRAYGGPDAAPPLVMVPAPIKRPYIWDLTPSVSAVRYCLTHGFRVYLLEWMPPEADGGADLEAYAGRAIGACVATVSKQAGGGAAIPHRSLAWRDTCGHIRCARASIGQRPRAAWSTAMLRAGIEPISRRGRLHDPGQPARKGCRCGIASIAGQRRRIALYLPLVAMDGRGSVLV